ncbi:Baculovirus F protein [Popillia japonica]|uniref:Baculovirus F protein n=1 Tax=Popillia japonica TaxID=7064 RepID=A0AAW1ITP9_POPJA
MFFGRYLCALGCARSELIKIEDKLSLLPIRQNTLYNGHKELTLVLKVDYSNLLSTWKYYGGNSYGYQVVTTYQNETLGLIKQKEGNGYQVVTTYQNETLGLIKQKEGKIDDLIRLIFGLERREKRGLFNVVGKVLSELTGTLDSDDGDKIEQQIAELYSNQQILKETPHAIFRIETPHAIFRIVNESINDIAKQINTQVQVLNDYISHTRSHNRIADGIQYQMLFVTLVNEELESLLLGLTLARNNILFPDLIDPVKLLQVLKTIPTKDKFPYPLTSENLLNLEQVLKTIPTKDKFPYPLTSENLLNLEDLMTIHFYIKEKEISFVLRLPLIDDRFYEQFKLYNIPILLNDKQYYQLQLRYDTVAINDDNTLCSFLPEYTIRNDIPCEVKILVNNERLDNCVKEIFEISNVQIQYLEQLILVISAKLLNDLEQLILVISAKLLNVKQKCRSITKSVIIQGTYYLNPNDYCKYYIGDQVVQNIIRTVNFSSFNFINDLPKYNNLSTLDVKSIVPLNVKNELDQA